MDVVLGVAVAGPVARLALVGSGAPGSGVLDQSVVDLADHPVETLTQTVVGTDRLLADESHRLVATRVCWADAPKAEQLCRALEDSGVHNVAVLSESEAVTALMRAAGRAGGVLVVDDDSATLSLVGSGGGDDSPPTMLARQPLAGGDATAALDTMMARLYDQPGAPQDVYLVGASSNLTGVADQLRETSTMRVEIPDDPTFALARGAAMAAMPQALLSAGDATAAVPAAGVPGDATAMVPATELAGSGAEEPQLAYSQAEDAEPFAGEADEYGDFDEDQAATTRLPLSRRSVLLGNAVIAFAVIGFATLAAAVAIAIRPTASAQPVVGHQNAAPGKFMPLLPTQQQAPVPAPPPDQPNAGFQGGVIPDSNGYIPPQLMSPGTGGTPPVAPVNPAPGAPGTPGFMPNPNGPLPIPIIIPYPGWHPQPPYVPPYIPPYTPPTTPTTGTTIPTPTSPTKTPYTPPTTTYSPPTTTHQAPTTTYSPPQTQTQTHTQQAPTTTYSPPQTQTQTHTQQTVTPQPPHTQQSVPQQPVPQQPVPQQPHGGFPHHGF